MVIDVQRPHENLVALDRAATMAHPEFLFLAAIGFKQQSGRCMLHFHTQGFQFSEFLQSQGFWLFLVY